ncbi:MAG: PQQ-like beta-propeller repeat protein, partial [Acidobacteria bacterium]|nr:PQQ-like beta-propeller repeat protein [Acidobacteriota bacterium]
MGLLKQRRPLGLEPCWRSGVFTLAGLPALALGLWLGLAPFGVKATGSASSAAGDGWSQFRGNAALTGISDSLLPDSLKLVWTLEVGESIESSAAIVDGVAYVGSQSGDLLAVSLSSGEELWRYRAAEFGIGESSPCVGQGLVYIGDLDGVLHAVDVRTGKAAWTFATEGEIKSSPVLVGSRVLVGSYDSHLYALEADTGFLLWKVMTEGYVHSTPSVADGVAYISGCDEIFRAIRVKDGREMYQVPSIAYTGASPALAGDAAYFGTFSNQVVSVSMTKQKVLWRYESKESQFPFYSSAAVVA